MTPVRLLRLLPTVCVFLFAVAAPAAPVLQIDINDALDNPADTAPGFNDYALSDNTLSVPPFTVDLNPVGGAALDDVHRATPATSGALTLGALYRDCVFAAGDNTANFFRVGLDTVLTGFTAGKRYTLTVWSYDSGSTGARTSDWSVLGLGGPQFGVNNYSFNGTTLPTSDTANRFSMSALADAGGQLVLRGRPSAPATTAQVFLNGLTVDESPDAPVSATPVLALDFNDRGAAGAANTFAGFQEFLLAGTEGAAQTTTARAFGSYTVTLNGIGGTMDDRLRATPVANGPFTESTVLRDFVFASSAATGLDARVQGLAANQNYLVEVWSFDSGSATLRTADWTVNVAFLWDDYLFNGANLPATNNDYKMAGVFTASATGELLISGRVVSGAPAVFINALRISSVGPAQVVDFGRPILSEFIAENSNGITDEDGETSDWIEIWNTTASALNLAGWRLTDDAALPAKWIFPAGVSVPSQGRLVVWASAKNRLANPAALHTNFALNKAAGSSLGFARPDGTIVTQFANLPAQRANVSYGLEGSVEPLTAGYFQTPTPGAANGASVSGFVADTTFDIARGFFSAPFTVRLSCATPGATIYYTTDGSDPTTGSAPYPGAAGIPISTTTVLRARAFAPPLAPTNTYTQTYIFNAHVQNQPAAPAGWPLTWGVNSEVNANDGAGDGTVPADYEMDPAVVGATLPGYGVQDALAALPALSITMNPADFHSVGGGIYTNPQSVGDAWEKACSLEFLETDGSGFHTNCGVRIHGNSSRRPWRMQKHSFRLAFRSSYGDGKLDYKLFDDTTVKTFDKLVLHAFFTDGWGLVSWDQPRYRPDDSVMFRDPWMKRSFADMGHARISGRYAHVYINGLYWGVYEVGERFDDAYCADHFGGLTTDYDVIAPGETVYVRSGTATAWDALFALVNSADLTTQANYESVAAQVDLAEFADYYLLHVHGDSEDWPHHNVFAYRNRVVAGSQWHFITWDQEVTFDPTLNVDRLATGAPNTGTDKTPGRLYQKLKVNPEFRLLFADRAHRHLHNGGALSLAVEQARWQSFADILDKPIVAESARWGDTADATPYGNAVPVGKVFKRETDWLPTIASVKGTHFPNLHNTANSFATITELRANGLYPLTEPPAFTQHGGNVLAGYSLGISAPAGTIYYTLDGRDPRTAFTGAIAGTLYAGPTVLTQSGTVKARALNGSEWSALTEATFVVGVAASAANLAVTELNYNPVVADEEFLELMNFSAGTIDLGGVHFEGLTFTFDAGTLLAAGERIVLVRNPPVFQARYGNGPRAFGPYTGALDNTGEEIAVLALNGADIVRFTYNDKAPWPTAPDGTGRTLVLRAPNAIPTVAGNWQSSATIGGSPGASDGVAFSGVPDADDDADGLRALMEHALGTSDLVPSLDASPTVAIEIFNAGAGLQPFLTMSARHNLTADDTFLTAEISTDLATWSSAASALVYLGETLQADGSAIVKWRAAAPFTGTPRQYLRLRATLAQ